MRSCSICLVVEPSIYVAMTKYIAGWCQAISSAMQEEGMSDSEKQFRRERAGGNYGAGTKELQAANYRVRKEQEEKRRRMFDEGLEKFQAGDIQGVRAVMLTESFLRDKKIELVHVQ